MRPLRNSPLRSPLLAEFPLPSKQLAADTPRLTYNELLDEIGRLEEVIYYLGKDKTELKDENNGLQLQITTLKTSGHKER